MYKFIGKGFPYAGRASLNTENPEEQSQGYGRKSSKANDKNTSELSLFKLASPLFLKDKDEQACSQAIGKCVLQNLTLCQLLANMMKSPPPELKQKIMDTLICMYFPLQVLKNLVLVHCDNRFYIAKILLPQHT